MNTKHTPGPWEWSREVIDGTAHCFLRGQPNEWNDTLVTAMREDLAAFPYSANTLNTRLIAAAPELLEALQASNEAIGKALDMAQKHNPETGYYHPVSPYELALTIRAAFTNARAAIAKAQSCA